MKVAIVLPTKNEEETIGNILRSLKTINGFDVIVVDDSTDKTKEISRDLGARVLDGKGNESPSIKYALENCEEYAVILDCDGSHPPSVIPDMIQHLMDGADLVVGSRYAKGGNRGASTLFSSFGNIFAKLILRTKTKDLTGRFVAGHKNTLLDNCDWLGRGEDSLDLCYNCEKRGLKIVEVPFVYEQRQGGQSKTNIGKYLWTYFWRIVGLRLDSFRMFSKDYISRGLSGDYLSENKSDGGFIVDAIYHIQVFPYFVVRGILFIPIIGSLFGLFCQQYYRGVLGFFLRGCYWKSKLGFVGKNCFFDTGVSIFPKSKNVYIDDDCFLENNCCIVCAKGDIRLSKNCHIGAGAYINGKPDFKMGRYSCIDTGCRVFGSTNLYEDENGKPLSYSSTAPPEMQRISEIGAKIGRCSFLGPNSTLVCANIGDNSVVGANSFVNSDIGDRCLYAGSPAKEIKRRE